MEFENIWKEYERELSSFVLSRVGDVEIQKEIMQEVALKIFTSIHTQKTIFEVGSTPLRKMP